LRIAVAAAVSAALSVVAAVVVAVLLGGTPESSVAVRPVAQPQEAPATTTEPEPEPQPWLDLPEPEPRPEPEKPEPPPESMPEPKPRTRPQTRLEARPRPQHESQSEPQAQPEPRSQARPQPQPGSRPEPRSRAGTQTEPNRSTQESRSEPLPIADSDGWPGVKRSERDLLNAPRRFELPPNAIMGLSVKKLQVYNVPVVSSGSQKALAAGAIHVPETSLPWSRTSERNVYIAGHRIGYPDTNSRLIFYELDELERGDEIVLRRRDGKSYRYRVSETFVAGPYDSWVMGRVRGRDMLTLQTCTPIPTFEKRLIVRADGI